MTMRRRKRRRGVGRERPPRSGAEAGSGRTREKVVRCERAGEEEMEARHREGRGVVRARRLEGSRTFGPRSRGRSWRPEPTRKIRV